MFFPLSALAHVMPRKKSSGARTGTLGYGETAAEGTAPWSSTRPSAARATLDQTAKVGHTPLLVRGLPKHSYAAPSRLTARPGTGGMKRDQLQDGETLLQELKYAESITAFPLQIISFSLLQQV